MSDKTFVDKQENERSIKIDRLTAKYGNRVKYVGASHQQAKKVDLEHAG